MAFIGRNSLVGISSKREPHITKLVVGVPIISGQSVLITFMFIFTQEE